MPSVCFLLSFITLYRWRKSAFDSTYAYLKNLKYFKPGEKVCIEAPDEPGIQYICNGKNTKRMRYWEYHYTVNGVPYCKSYFREEDDDELPYTIKIYYHWKNPKMMYMEGGFREGVLFAVLIGILGCIFLIGPIVDLLTSWFAMT